MRQQAWIQLIPEAVVVVDPRGTIVHANARCESLLGWTSQDLVGQRVEMLVPARFAGHEALRHGYMQKPTLRQMGADLDLFALHKNGDEIAVDISLRAVDIDGAPHVVASIRDVRETREILEKVKLQSVALEAAASGVMITRRDGVITWANPAACRMSGYSADELVGRAAKILKSGVHPPEFFEDLWRTILDGRTWHGTLINRHKSGALYHEEQTIAPVRSKRGEITHFVAVRQDITARVEAELELRRTRDELALRVREVEQLHAELREQAIRDPLTGLFNRRYLDETLPREIARAQREGAQLALVLIDLDHFKRVNDDHGHAAGDHVLSAFGAILLARSRVGDVACRFGGEELVVLLVGADAEIASRRAEEWREAFATHSVSTGASTLRCTASMGVAALSAGEDAATLFARADTALYAAKHAGRNRVVLSDARAR